MATPPKGTSNLGSAAANNKTAPGWGRSTGTQSFTVRPASTAGTAPVTNSGGAIFKPPTPAPPPALRAPAPSTGGGTSGGGSNFGQPITGISSFSAPAGDPGHVDAAPAPKDWANATDEELIAADGSLAVQIAALKAAYDRYVNDEALQLGQYDEGVKTGWKQLGWQDADGDVGTEGGEFNWTDQNTSSGRGRRSLVDDHAARGMLRSSAFTNNEATFRNALNEQLASTSKARQDFRNTKESEKKSFELQRDTTKNIARQEAIARLSSGLISGAVGGI